MACAAASSSNDPDSGSQLTVLPEDYAPSENTVIIGRGKKYQEHEGNRRLCVMVKAELEQYVKCRSKTDKSVILLSVVHQVCQLNKDECGFIKKCRSTGRWLQLNEVASRVSVAQAFRDACSHRYRSSKQSKQHRRRVAKFMSTNTHEDIAVTGTGGFTSTIPMSKDSHQMRINLGKFGVGLSNTSPTSTDAPSGAWGAPAQMTLASIPRMIGQSWEGGAMMPQGGATTMGMQCLSHTVTPLRSITPEQRMVGQTGQMLGIPSLQDFEPLPVDPRGLCDDQDLSHASEEEDDDFVDVFHSTPLCKMAEVLLD